MVEEDPLIGQTVSGRFAVLDHLGDGGMGIVYKARQEPIGRMVALKVLLSSVASDERTTQRFLNEARIISALKSPHTVTLIDFGQTDDGKLYIAMEYLGGGQLTQLMRGRRLKQVAALEIARQICASLAEAHAQDIIHRDLKPDNVLLDEVEGEDFVVKVVDFGLAKLNLPTDAMLTAPGTRLGTAEYMSPEQAFAQPLDHTTDLYALGVILYEMITGHLPFEAENPMAMYVAHKSQVPAPMSTMAPNLRVDDEVEALVQKLLAKKPAGRPESATAVGIQLEAILGRLRPTTRPPIAAEPVSEEVEPRGDADEAFDLAMDVSAASNRQQHYMWALIAALAITVIVLLLV